MFHPSSVVRFEGKFVVRNDDTCLLVTHPLSANNPTKDLQFPAVYDMGNPIHGTTSKLETLMVFSVVNPISRSFDLNALQRELAPGPSCYFAEFNLICETSYVTGGVSFFKASSLVNLSCWSTSPTTWDSSHRFNETVFLCVWIH